MYRLVLVFLIQIFPRFFIITHIYKGRLCAETKILHRNECNVIFLFLCEFSRTKHGNNSRHNSWRERDRFERVIFVCIFKNNIYCGTKRGHFHVLISFFFVLFICIHYFDGVNKSKKLCSRNKKKNFFEINDTIFFWKLMEHVLYIILI